MGELMYVRKGVCVCVSCLSVCLSVRLTVSVGGRASGQTSGAWVPGRVRCGWALFHSCFVRLLFAAGVGTFFVFAFWFAVFFALGAKPRRQSWFKV